ncbi:MAG: hypothetical protein JST92_20985, partial [Deltaproteobacteria bacterium]|nr:hypothetical protein [Deltaproteobacteria bacterium]
MTRSSTLAARAILGLALLGLALPALAHAVQAQRTLRLELREDRTDALLSMVLPKGPLTTAIVGPPPGSLPGEEKGAAQARVWGARAEPEALRGLAVSVIARAGVADALPVADKLPFETLEASASQTGQGALKSALLLRARAIVSGESLRLEATAGLPLTVELIAPTGTALVLLEGLGDSRAGGLTARPRKGTPAVVRV